MRLCVFDVPLAVGCILRASQGENENIPFQLLCHSTDRAYKYGGFDPGTISYTSSVSCTFSVLWSIRSGVGTKTEAAFNFN